MNLEELITNYQAPSQAAELIKATRTVLLVGISSAGKDTIKKRLLESDDFRDIVSHTTRAPRSNDGVPEQDAVDYHFITLQQAQDMVVNGEFIEAKFVHGTVYGTSVAALEKIRQAGKIALTDVDVQGVDEYKALSQAVTALFILPPDYAVWRERFRKRYDSDEAFEADFPKRSRTAVAELEHALSLPYYHFIINDELDRAVRVASEIAHRQDSFNRHDDEARLRARELLEAIQASVS